MARGDWKSAGCHTGLVDLRGGDCVDDINRRSGLYYARELHELADLLFYEAVRPALAANVGLRFVVGTVTRNRQINSRLCGFLAGYSLFAPVGFYQKVVACLLYWERPWGWYGFVLDENVGRLNAYIATLVFPRQMVFLVALAIPLAGVLFWLSRWCPRRLAT